MSRSWGSDAGRDLSPKEVRLPRHQEYFYGYGESRLSTTAEAGMRPLPMYSARSQAIAEVASGCVDTFTFTEIFCLKIGSFANVKAISSVSVLYTDQHHLWQRKLTVAEEVLQEQIAVDSTHQRY
jgi:hypothetical protein